MQDEVLAGTLNLSENQARTLFANRDKYDLSRMAMCGGVLYVPIKPRGVYEFARRIIRGARIDTIKP